MPLQFTTTGAQANDGIKCGIHGRDGSGKTSLIPTAPRPLILDFEGKTLSIAAANIPSIRCRTWADWLEVKAWLQGSESAKNYDTLFPDSISELAEISLLFWKSQNKDVRRAYQEHRDWFTVALSTLLMLPQKHVCILARSTLTEQPDGTKLYEPAMEGMKRDQSLGYRLNEMFFLNLGSYAAPGPNNTQIQVQYRYLQTQQDVYVQARDNSRTLLEKEEPNLSKIFAKIQAGAVIS